MIKKALFSCCALAVFAASPAFAQTPAGLPTPDSIVAASSAEEWTEIAPEDVLVMELAPDRDGNERRVVIQLMPAPFSQPWVENIRALARDHWWDETSVYRVVDNWVAQWGDVSEEKPLPEGMVSPDAEYGTYAGNHLPFALGISGRKQQLIERIEGMMVFASQSTFVENAFFQGFPIAGEAGLDQIPSWPMHCYGSVGVARDLAPDTGTGAELYAVIGQAPRQLDRNIAVIGRVIEGMEHLSTLKRGTGDAGVYEDRDEDTAIISVRLASEIPNPPSYEYLSSDSYSFSRYVTLRANRKDEFYQISARGVDICNVQVPVRAIEAEISE